MDGGVGKQNKALNSTPHVRQFVDHSNHHPVFDTHTHFIRWWLTGKSYKWVEFPEQQWVMNVGGFKAQEHNWQLWLWLPNQISSKFKAYCSGLTSSVSGPSGSQICAFEQTGLTRLTLVEWHVNKSKAFGKCMFLQQKTRLTNHVMCIFKVSSNTFIK